MIHRKGARSAVAAVQGGAAHQAEKAKQLEDDQVDLGEWKSNDGGSFSDYDSDEEKRRL